MRPWLRVVGDSGSYPARLRCLLAILRLVRFRANALHDFVSFDDDFIRP